MGLGGPVWHVSAAWHGGGFVPFGALEAACLSALAGVGDEQLGQWSERGTRYAHLRRRLSAAECELVGPVVDVRGTPDALKRFTAVHRFVVAAGDGALAVAERELAGG